MEPPARVAGAWGRGGGREEVVTTSVDPKAFLVGGCGVCSALRWPRGNDTARDQRPLQGEACDMHVPAAGAYIARARIPPPGSGFAVLINRPQDQMASAQTECLWVVPLTHAGSHLGLW